MPNWPLAKLPLPSTIHLGHEIVHDRRPLYGVIYTLSMVCLAAHFALGLFNIHLSSIFQGKIEDEAVDICHTRYHQKARHTLNN